jgi:hypothetical protein
MSTLKKIQKPVVASQRLTSTKLQTKTSCKHIHMHNIKQSNCRGEKGVSIKRKIYQV